MKNKMFEANDAYKEFNMMQMFLFRVNDMLLARDEAFNDGDLKKIYRSSMTVLGNSIPRFRDKKVDEKLIEQLQSDLFDIGKMIISIEMQSKQVQERNRFAQIEKLYKWNLRLNQMMFDAAMVFPENEEQTFEDYIKGSF